MEEVCQCHRPVRHCRQCDAYRCYNPECPRHDSHLVDPHLVRCQNCGKASLSDFTCPFCDVILINPNENYQQAFNPFQLPSVPLCRCQQPLEFCAKCNGSRCRNPQCQWHDPHLIQCQSCQLWQMDALACKQCSAILYNPKENYQQAFNPFQLEELSKKLLHDYFPLIDWTRDAITALHTNNPAESWSGANQLCKAGFGINQQLSFNTIKPGFELGMITWNINKQGEDKVEVKRNTLIRLFQQHRWLDVIALQELFKTGLETLLSDEAQEEFTKNNLEIYPGPPLLIRRDESKVIAEHPRMKTYLASGERYALIIRKSPDIQYNGWSIFSIADDKWYTQNEIASLAETEPWILWVKLDRQKTEFTKFEYGIYWSKQERFYEKEKALHYRPFVVHHLIVSGKKVNVGIVHTSPKGKSLFRKTVFEEIKGFLQAVKKKAEEHPAEYWILPGDYYLDPVSTIHIDSEPNPFSLTASEAKIKEERRKKEMKLAEGTVLTRPFEEEVSKANLKFAVAISATNQSHLTKDVATAIEDKEKGKYFLRGYSQKTIVEENRSITKYVNNSRADFFLCTLNFTITYAGLISPRGRGLLHVDPHHHALNWWSAISDHAPVGAVFCTFSNSPKLQSIKQDELVKTRVDQVNSQLDEIYRAALAKLSESLDNLTEVILNFPYHNDFRHVCEMLYLFVQSVLIHPDFAHLNPKFTFRADFIKIMAVFSQSEMFDHYKPHLIEFLLNCERTTKPANTPQYGDQNKKLAREIISFKILPALKALGYRIDDFETAAEDDTYVDVEKNSLQ